MIAISFTLSHTNTIEHMDILRRFRKDIVLGIALFLLPFVLPHIGISNLSLLVTPTSGVFAIVTGFFIADAMSNYLRLQTLISEENAALISIAENAREIDPANSVKVDKAIDDYMIAILNLTTLNHASHTEQEVDAIGSAIDSLRVEPEKKDFFDHILSMKDKIFACRQEVSLAAKKTLTPGHWIVLIVLGTLVGITVIGMRDGTILINLVTGVMIIGMQAILILLREMDSNHLLERKLAYESPRDVFHAVHQPPYYPSFSPLGARVPNTMGLYRLGRDTSNQSEQYDLIKI